MIVSVDDVMFLYESRIVAGNGCPVPEHRSEITDSEIIGLFTKTLAATLDGGGLVFRLLSGDVGLGVEGVDNGAPKFFFEFTGRSRVVLSG